MRKNRKPIWTLSVTTFLIVCFSFASLSFGQLVPKPGEVIDKSNYQKYKHLFPEEFLAGFEDGWEGTFEPISVKVVGTKPAPFPKTVLEISEKNRGKYTIDTDGFIAGGYDSSGMPFPGATPDDQEFCAKLMWNYTYTLKYGDTYSMYAKTLSKRRGEPVRMTAENNVYHTFFANRYYEDPKPLIKTPDDLYFADLPVYVSPPSLKYFQFLSYRYIDVTKSDDTYIYLPQMRRVLRGEAGQRSTPVAGTMQAPDDFDGGFNGKIYEFNYKFIEKKKVLGCVRSRMTPKTLINQLNAAPDAVPFPSDNWELRDIYVIEIIPKDPRYPQSRKVIFIDPENLRVLHTVAWDRAGKPWKIWVGGFSPNPLCGEEGYMLTWQVGIDLQFGMGGIICLKGKFFDQEYNYADFMPSSMIKRAK